MFKVFVDTILPLFTIILIGYILKRRNIVTSAWSESANKITYYIAVPAILFKSVVGQNASGMLSKDIFIAVVIPLILVLFISTIISLYFFNLEKSERATFIHSTIHGNIGYMAYAVAYYALDSQSFNNVVVISSIIIIIQNILGVIILTANRASISISQIVTIIVKMVAVNPIVISVFAALIFSFYGFKIPIFFDRLIKILSDIGLPTALLLIGAGLVFEELHILWRELTVIAFMKLLFLPFAGFVVSYAIDLPKEFILPLLILLSSPTATITYVMAVQLGGSPNLASVAVSLQILLCGVSYSAVIGFFGCKF